MVSERATPDRAARQTVRAALFAALTAVGALLSIQVPVSTVPFTLQMVFTWMSGLLLGRRGGALSQLVYVTMGAMGVPVFARGGAGVGYLLGPTGGYLLGLVGGAWVAGMVAEQTRKICAVGHPLRVVGYLLGALAGTAVVYILGIWRLASVLKASWMQAAVVGILPFVIGDLMKALAAALLVLGLEKRGLGQG